MGTSSTESALRRMERLKRMGVVTPRGTPPAWTVRRDPGGFLPEEQALEFGQTLQRVAANDPNLNSVTCHETAEDTKTMPSSIAHGERAQALANNTHVTAVDLSHCCFGDDGVEAICASLPSQTRILRLRDNNITDRATEGICQALRSCPRLQSLDLSENEITDKGAKNIAAGAKFARSLESLNLSENDELTEKGGDAVVKGCSGCPQLRHLDLGETVVVKNMGDNGGTAAETLLSH